MLRISKEFKIIIIDLDFVFRIIEMYGSYVKIDRWRHNIWIVLVKA